MFIKSLKWCSGDSREGRGTFGEGSGVSQECGGQMDPSVVALLHSHIFNLRRQRLQRPYMVETLPGPVADADDVWSICSCPRPTTSPLSRASGFTVITIKVPHCSEGCVAVGGSDEGPLKIQARRRHSSSGPPLRH